MKTVYINPPFNKPDNDRRVSVPMDDMIALLRSYNKRENGMMDVGASNYDLQHILARWASYETQIKDMK